MRRLALCDFSDDPAITDHASLRTRCELDSEKTSLKSGGAAFSGMPLFAMDIGGTLTKVVYFEEKSMEGHPEVEIVKKMSRYLTENNMDPKGQVDIHLQMNDVNIGGRTGCIHFMRFPTTQLEAFIDIAEKHRMGSFFSTVGATGGGAFKFEQQFTNIKVKLAKFDEFDSLLNGMMHIVTLNATDEVYYWYNPEAEASCNLTQEHLSKKVRYDFCEPYPFIIVNIGSGVSVLAVHGPSKYSRIYGSSLGGGTFLGLSCLLTECNSFEEAISLAAKGDNTKVDKLVRDIYGGGYEKFDLPGNIVASSFGHMNIRELRQNACKADLARATLVTITNNISSIARMCALNLGINRVGFVGNFLRINPISSQLVANAMDYWSKGSLKALFFKHEGYFGAVGCLLEFNKSN